MSWEVKSHPGEEIQTEPLALPARTMNQNPPLRQIPAPTAACSTSEIAHQWGVSAKRVRQLCQAGRVPGAQKIGRDWVIPADAAVTPGSRGPQRRR